MRACSINNCNKKHCANGFCAMHNARFKNYNKTELNAPSKNSNHGTGRLIDKDGYLQVRINKKYFREHRIVMEKHLGRKLLVSEAVHHINGIRTDNRIENLEVLTFSQHRRKHIEKNHELEQKVKEFYLKGIPLTKIPEYLPICYSSAYWCVRNSGIKIRGRNNRNVVLSKEA